MGAWMGGCCNSVPAVGSVSEEKRRMNAYAGFFYVNYSIGVFVGPDISKSLF